MMVKEELPIGSAIGNLTAVDEDIEENALIDYVITCKSKQWCGHATAREM